jgi:hypothetical protein
VTSLVAETGVGLVSVDLDTEESVLEGNGSLPRTHLDIGLPLVVAADAHGARVVAVVERRPPLVVSDDAGVTWREAGGGLPPGRAVAISPEHPDLIAYASATRVHVSEDGGLFWRRLAPELIDAVAVAWRESV